LQPDFAEKPEEAFSDSLLRRERLPGSKRQRECPFHPRLSNATVAQKPKDRMVYRRSLPQSVSLGNPAVLLGTCFGIGLLPLAPGSFGALAAIPVGWLFIAYFGRPALLLLAVTVFAVGVWCADICARRIGVADPNAVVIDEVAAQWLVLLVVPQDLLYYAAAFLAFRIFDIWKPFPVSWAEQSFRGGFGVMIDDVFAAGYASIILYSVSFALGCEIKVP
jgi:phosphatidylglycerophosphatase A